MNLFWDDEPKKRVQITAGKRIYIWEHSEIYGRTCSICGRKITKLSDLELDHTKPYSKGGTKLALAHRDCNRMKGSKSLAYVQKTMVLKTTKKKSASKTKPKKKRKSSDTIFDFKW
jgi:5-methylcytosine-specific restriction endonuclease McrA